MKQFLDKDFLLSTDMAKTIYHDYAENMLVGMGADMPALTITAISTHRRSMKTVSLKTLPRYGWAATITNGVRCVLTVLMRNTLPATAQTERNSRHGLRQCLS